MIFAASIDSNTRPKPSALYPAIAALCETNLWTAVNGFAVARVMSAVEAEYRSAKSAAAITDISALCRSLVTGRDAAAFLSRLTSAPALSLDIGESACGLILDDEGFVIDLAEVARIDAEKFMLASPCAHERRMQLAARSMTLEIENATIDKAAIGVIGPEASSVLKAAGVKNATDAGANVHFANGMEIIIRPVTFGISNGFEILTAHDDAVAFWDRLLRDGRAAPAGLDLMEVLRIEGGAPRTGVDFVSSERGGVNAMRSPGEIGLPHLAPLDGGWFSGRRGVRRMKKRPARGLATLLIDADQGLPGAAVFVGGRAAGRITSCAWSPNEKGVIAVADITRQSRDGAYQVATPSRPDGRVGAQRFVTPESRLAEKFVNADTAATDFGV